MNTQRQPGYYHVKFKGDTATRGDMDIIMGYCYPGPDKWVIGKYDPSDGGWSIDGYDIGEDYFSEINETRIVEPGEKTEFASYVQGLLNKAKPGTKITSVVATLPDGMKLIITGDDADKHLFADQSNRVTRCVNLDGKTWDELSSEEKEQAKRNTLPG